MDSAVAVHTRGLGSLLWSWLRCSKYRSDMPLSRTERFKLKSQLLDGMNMDNSGWDLRRTNMLLGEFKSRVEVAPGRAVVAVRCDQDDFDPINP